MTDWLTLPELADHSRLSLSTLQRAMTRRDNKLPSYLVAGRRLVRRAEFDLWATGKLARPNRPILRKSEKTGRKSQYATKTREPLDKDFQWRTSCSGDD